MNFNKIILRRVSESCDLKIVKNKNIDTIQKQWFLDTHFVLVLHSQVLGDNQNVMLINYG